MRSETEIKNLILDFAEKDNRVRAVLLNGSRANVNVKPDILQDFDIMFIVDNLESFTTNHSWIDVFGERIICQLPNEMNLKYLTKKERISFSYLMLFKDKNRIDLTLFPLQKIKSNFKLDSLTLVWLDKDNLFTKLSPPSDKSYFVQRPTQKEFLDTCNEFWWVSIYIIKGLIRSEIIYAKEMFEIVVRPMFMKMIEWKIGVENGFSVSTGKGFKFLKKYVTDDFYERILSTYANFEIEENWKALLLMAKVFQQTSNFVAERLGFDINQIEEQNAITYLNEQFTQN